MRVRGFVASLLAVACGAAPNEGAPPPVSAVRADLPGSVGCERAAPTKGGSWSIEVGGRRREFTVHLPRGYDHSKPTPIVLSFHGFMNSPGLQETFTELEKAADEAGFIAVFPRGSGWPQLSWNAGRCCGEAFEKNIDDVAFTAAMLDELEDRLCVDDRRVYASGYSNGGLMSYRLACELADRIAAVGAVAGTRATELCEPSRPVPVIHFHGTADDTVPVDGRPDLGIRSVEETVEFWVQHNRCTAQAKTFVDRGDATCQRWSDCAGDADVALCLVEGGGHAWPGGIDNVAVEAVAGTVTQAISANQLMWSFFEQHPLPQASGKPRHREDPTPTQSR